MAFHDLDCRTRLPTEKNVSLEKSCRPKMYKCREQNLQFKTETDRETHLANRQCLVGCGGHGRCVRISVEVAALTLDPADSLGSREPLQ